MDEHGFNDDEYVPYDDNSSLPYYDEMIELGANFKMCTWPLFLVIGTFGNAISLVVLRKLSRDVMSTCIYLSAQCAADLLLLFTRCGNALLLLLTNYTVDVTTAMMSRSEIICKSLPFICGSIYHLSRWLVTISAIEGVIACRYPHRVPNYCTLTNAHATIMLMTSLVICVNVHFFWSFELIVINDLDKPRQIFCTFAKNEHRQSVYFQETIWPALNNAVGDVIPSTLIVACTVAMAISIAGGRHRGSAAYRQWCERYIIEPDGVERLVWLYLAAALMFVCLLVPGVFIEMSKYFVDQSQPPSAVMSLFIEISETAEYGWLSLKAIVYVVASGRFRKELKWTFRLRR